MAALSYGYTKAAKKIRNGTIKFDGTHSIRAVLVGPGYTPNQDGHEYYADLGANANSNTITELTNMVETTTDYADTFDFQDIVLNGITYTARYLVVYDNTAQYPNKPLIFFVDFGENKVASGGTFTVSWSTEGVLKLIVDQYYGG
jgi:hypothetical protein